MPVSCARSALVALAMLAGMPVIAAPEQLSPASLPILLPPNAAFGLNYDVFPDSSLRYQFRHTADFGGTFGLDGSFFGVGDKTEFLYCENPEGSPSRALRQLSSGQLIDDSLVDGVCQFSNDPGDGLINPGDFSGSGGFVALRIVSTIDPLEPSETYYGYLELRINAQGDLELLGGAREDQSDTSIQTRSSVDDLFDDRFEPSGARGIDPIGMPMTLPHDPAFSLSIWLREEIDADFVFSPDDASSDFLLRPGNSPGFKRALADISADPESVAVAVAPATSISDSLSTPADRAWRGDMSIQPAEFILADRYLPVRFSINADPPFFGYLGLSVNANGALVVRSGDWQTSSNTPIDTP